MKELKVTDDRVRAAAEKCPTAKEVLKEMFPEAFASHEFNLTKLSTTGYTLFTNDQSKAAGFDSSNFMQVRSTGIYADKAFYLHRDYNWKIIDDHSGELLLVPIKKSP